MLLVTPTQAQHGATVTPWRVRRPGCDAPPRACPAFALATRVQLRKWRPRSSIDHQRDLGYVNVRIRERPEGVSSTTRRARARATREPFAARSFCVCGSRAKPVRSRFACSETAQLSSSCSGRADVDGKSSADTHPHRNYYLTRTTISISTQTPSGNALVPTADRACLPLSSNTLPSKSEHPLMTAGCSVKPSTQFTKPTTWRALCQSISPPPGAHASYLDDLLHFIKISERSLERRQ